MGETTAVGKGSRKLAAIALAVAVLPACGNAGPARTEDKPPTDRKQTRSPQEAAELEPAPPNEAPAGTHSSDVQGGASCLGVADTGIFGDLDERVQLALPRDYDVAAAQLVVDDERALLLVYLDGWPTKIYPLAGDGRLEAGDQVLAVRAADEAELAPIVAGGVITTGQAADDRDGDGIPDALDVLIGARKTVINAASYEGGYIPLDYPNGDVPREVGVCTDVVVRAVRNAGLDIQAELQRDIRRSPASYPMIKRRGDANIDHRRVKTLLPYFRRQWDQRSAALDDVSDPLRPGDVVFMDTFPDRHGPDHIGIISDRIAESGKPYVINNWTDGTVTAEMDLLDWVPVTHRFRIQ